MPEPLALPDLGRHVVQFYGDDDESLVTSVCRFVADGLALGEGALVIATAPHREAFAIRLAAEDAAVVAMRDGRLIMLDAAGLLARFLVGGEPDPDRFAEVVGREHQAIRARTGGGRVRAYGEMVGLLWLEGHAAAAARVEECWNGLLMGSEISLFCGYPIDVFGESFVPERLDPILCAHTHLLTANGGLDRALDRAMDELLGADAAAASRAAVAADRPPSWGGVPRAEATILWLRQHLGAGAGAILERARFYRASFLNAH